MSQLKRNVIANFVGNFWIGLVSLAFVPLYIHLLGVEAYGLMGLFISLQALLSILDLGISTTLNREIARLSALADAARDMRNLVRTLELIYWGVGAGLGVALVALAPFLAHHWLRGEYLSPDALQRAVVLMGIAVGFQWPSSFYSGGLQGLQRQVLLNPVTAGAATVRAGGAALILWLVSPTIQAFFGWLADCGGGLESVALPSRTGLPADVPAPVGVKCMAVCSGNERHLDSGAHVDATG